MLEPPTIKLRVLIADHDDTVREETRALIEGKPGWQVCGMAKTGREVVERAGTLMPDIIVLDTSIPELDGLDTVQQIRSVLPQTEVLIFTAIATDDAIREVFKAGLKSFVNKTEAHTYLLDAIESLSRHKPFFTEKVAEVLFSRMVNRDDGTSQPALRRLPLTAREEEIVKLLAEGKRNKEIADALEVSVRTVEAHRSSILHKLNLDSVAALVRYAIRHKLIEP